MVKPIKDRKGIPAIAIPFAPTQTPSHGHVVDAAKAVINLVQVCFSGNPGPVIVALKCAEQTYISNAEKNGGMDVDTIEKFEVLGVALSKALLAQVEEDKKKAESGILTADTRIVGADGRPLTLPVEPEPEPESDPEESAIILESKG